MEQIRIAVYDSDAAYTERFCGYMGEVPERAEVFYPVYEKQVLDDMIAGRQVDAVLVPEESRNEYPPFIGDIHVGYFTSQPDTAAGKVFRYQSRRNLFQSIELLFSQEDTAVKMVVFSGAGAHTGCSAAAGAYAVHLAAEEQKVLYINLNSLGDGTMIFQGGNPRDLQTLLERLIQGDDPEPLFASILNRDVSGVYFFDNARIPAGLMDVGEETAKSLFRKLIDDGEFRYLVVEADFVPTHTVLAAWACADRVVLVSDGTAAANRKLQKIRVLQEEKELAADKTVCLYNRFQKQTGRKVEDPALPCAGCMEALPPAGTRAIVEALAGNPVWNELLR